MFYDLFCSLCKEHGLTPSGAATKIGFNRATITMWKNTGKAPKGDLLIKIADYFGVSIDYLLGTETEKAPIQKDERSINDDDIKFALWGDATDIDDDDLEDVRRYAAFVRERKKDKK